METINHMTEFEKAIENGEDVIAHHDQRIAQARAMAEHFGVDEGIRKLVEASEGRLSLSIKTHRYDGFLPLRYTVTKTEPNQFGHRYELGFIGIDEKGRTKIYTNDPVLMLPHTQKSWRKRALGNLTRMVASAIEEKLVDSRNTALTTSLRNQFAFAAFETGIAKGEAAIAHHDQRVAQAQAMAQYFGVDEGIRTLVEASEGRLTLSVETHRFDQFWPLRYRITKTEPDQFNHHNELGFVAIDEKGRTDNRVNAVIPPVTQEGRRKKAMRAVNDLIESAIEECLIADLAALHRPEMASGVVQAQTFGQ